VNSSLDSAARLPQQRALPVVGCVTVNAAATGTEREVAFRQGLGEAGYSEGQNVTVEFHILDGKFDRRGPYFPWHFVGVF
jgi:putative ABC transport system substrate-binding protein